MLDIETRKRGNSAFLMLREAVNALLCYESSQWEVHGGSKPIPDGQAGVRLIQAKKRLFAAMLDEDALCAWFNEKRPEEFGPPAPLTFFEWSWKSEADVRATVRALLMRIDGYLVANLADLLEVKQDQDQKLGDVLSAVREALEIEGKALHDKGTFAAVMSDWDTVTAAGLHPSTVRQRQRAINNDLVPKLKNRPMDGITRLELTALLKDVEKRAPEVARNLRNHLWGMFEYAIDSGLMENNPVPPLRVMKKRNQSNHPALAGDQIGDFLRALDAATAINKETRIAMLLVLLTACRKAEVIEARWDELDLKAAQWEIPAARMKAKHPHWVPLSRQAVELLTNLRRIVPANREHLFPNRLDPRRPMANRSLNALMERLGFGGEGTPHGMRAAFSTHFNRLGASVDVIEHCLAHVPANAVRAAYNRHAYQDERRMMLQTWADDLDGVRESRGAPLLQRVA